MKSRLKVYPDLRIDLYVGEFGGSGKTSSVKLDGKQFEDEDGCVDLGNVSVKMNGDTYLADETHTVDLGEIKSSMTDEREEMAPFLLSEVNDIPSSLTSRYSLIKLIPNSGSNFVYRTYNVSIGKPSEYDYVYVSYSSYRCCVKVGNFYITSGISKVHFKKDGTVRYVENVSVDNEGGRLYLSTPEIASLIESTDNTGSGTISFNPNIISQHSVLQIADLGTYTAKKIKFDYNEDRTYVRGVINSTSKNLTIAFKSTKRGYDTDEIELNSGKGVVLIISEQVIETIREL